MHFVIIIIGLVLGAAIGADSGGLFGALAGALIASLLYQLGSARSDIRALIRRLDAVEKRQRAIPVAEMPEPAVAKRSATTERVSIYEPESPEETPTEVPAPPPVAAALATDPDVIAHQPTPVGSREPSTVEHLVVVAKRWLTTGNVPVKVGIIISFFGVSFLLKYAIDNSILEIPIGLRYVFVAAFAGVLMWLGWRVKEANRVYALSLQGGAVGILFLVVFAAFQLHHLLSPGFAFSVLVLLTVATGWLAVIQESRALALLGTTGGFLAPLLVSTGSGNHIALFSYYLVLNAAVLGVAWVRAWRELNIVGFAFTFGVGTIWGLQYYVPEKFATTEPFLIAFFVFYTVIAILFAFRTKPQLRGYVDGTLVFGTPTIAFALQSQMLGDSEYGMALSAACVAVFYAALAGWLWKRDDDRFDLLRHSFTALSIAFGTVAVPLALDDRWTAIAWALEGAALVWVGVRQSTSLAMAAGILLSFAGGVAFVRFGWKDDIGTPVLNGNFVGTLLISVTALCSAWLLRENRRDREWQKFASVVLLLWGLVWWFGGGWREIIDRAPYQQTLHLVLTFGSLSFAAIGYAGHRLDWMACRRVTLGLLPFLAIAAFVYLFEHDHFLEGFGVAAWAIAIVCHLLVLRMYGDRTAATWWHLGGALLLTAMAGYEVFWLTDKWVINEVWPFTAAMFTIGGIAAALINQRDSHRWPFATQFRAYYLASLALTCAYLVFVLLACMNDPGSPAPLPYVPIFNPLDLLSVAGVLLAVHIMRNDHLEFGINVRNKAVLGLWGGTAFVFATLAVMRAVHHLAGVAWDSGAMMQSTVLQASLTIFWALLGMSGMLLGNKRSNRNVWIVGVGLMTIVVLKLMVVDMSNTGTVARIVSFLGVGVLLLVVGYFAPVPPREGD